MAEGGGVVQKAEGGIAMALSGNREIEIDLHQIEPAVCQRPHVLAAYVALLREGKEPPPVWVWQFPLLPDRRRSAQARRAARLATIYRFRICDGTHRCAAARAAGHIKIRARILFPTRNKIRSGRSKKSRFASITDRLAICPA
jgi:hypothetical protein